MTDLPFDYPATPATGTGSSRRAKPAPDPTRQRTNRLNRNRGKGTSRDLAAYLGWQNVEGLLLPWDVQAGHGRIQSKRDLEGAGPTRCRRLIDAIPEGDYLRGVYHVAPGWRLTSGPVTLLLREWVNWYGWDVPYGAPAAFAGGDAWLLRLPLPLFASIAGRTK